MKLIVAVLIGLHFGDHHLPAVDGFSWTSRPKSSLSRPRQSPHQVTVTTQATRAPDATVASTEKVDDPRETIQSVDAVICGGGPAGLLTAIMLAQKSEQTYRHIQLYDRLSEPPGADDEAVWNDVAKFYLIGLGPRGQTALRKYGVWEEVEQRCVAVRGRKDWPPDSKEGVERIFTAKDKRVTTQVLPRDKLVGVLHQHILDHYSDRIALNYGYEVRPLDFNFKQGQSVLVEVSRCAEEIARLNPSSVKSATEADPAEIMCDVNAAQFVTTKLLVGADGTVRTIANAMEREDQLRFKAMNPLRRLWAGQPFRVTRYVDDNQRIYKTIPMKVPADWRGDLNYSARTKGGRLNFDALPANNKGEYCGVLLLRKDDPMAQADTDPAELRRLLDEAIPQFSVLLDDETVATVAKKPVSYLPAFRYAGPRLHQENRCVILGDCAHTVKPYFGLGANSALEDVSVLGDILDANQNDLPTAVREFTRQRAGESRALVRISRDLDRPGKLGFITFILPLILDSIFSGLAPRIFMPNVIAMLQREDYTFERVARRKRLDRILQLTVIGSGLVAATTATQWALRRLAQAVGQSVTTVTAGILGLAVAAKLLQRAGRFLVPHLAPADVLTRLGRKSPDSTPVLPNNTTTMTDSRTRNGESFLTPLGFGNKA